MMKCYPEGLVKLFTDPAALGAGLNPAEVKRLLEGTWPADRSDVNAWRARFLSLKRHDAFMAARMPSWK